MKLPVYRVMNRR